MIPPCLRIKHLADRKAIAFATTDQPSICDTHFDRDTTLLFLLAGKKEIYLMPRRERLPHEIVHHNSSIFETVDPFSDAEAGKLGSEWKRIVVLPGTALLIPQDWMHAVRSDSHTVGISIQVEITPTQKEAALLHSVREKKPRNMICETKDLGPAREEMYSAAFACRSGGRTRRRCMLCDGPILFLMEEFWFPVLDNEDDVVDKRLPLVAEKFICLTCVPRTRMPYLEPDQVPNEAAEYATDYRFFVGSKGDYETRSKI